MKLLLFSDLHLDTHFYGVANAPARRAALRTTLTRITALARSEKVDAVLCGGDLYEHDRWSPDTATFLRTTFEEVALPVYLAPGDHDPYSRKSLYHQVSWTPNVHVFTDSTPVELADGLTLWGGTHHQTPDRAGVNLALFHGTPPPEGFDHAFLGHDHTPTDAERHTYPGNPDPLTFGETGPRGAVVCTVHADGRVDRVRHNVSTSEVHDITVDVTGPGEVREHVSAAVEDLIGTVRVTITGQAPLNLDLDELAEIAPHLDALVPRLGQVTHDFAALAEERSVRGQFVRDVQAADLDDDTKREVLVTGLRALADH